MSGNHYHLIFWANQRCPHLSHGSKNIFFLLICQNLQFDTWFHIVFFFIFIGDPIPIGSPIIVTIWKVVFTNKSRKLGWIWMKLGRWGWGLKRLSLARFQWNRTIGFGESAKNGSQNHFLWREARTTSATFLGSISAKLSMDTYRDRWFHIPERFPLRGQISGEKTSF